MISPHVQVSIVSEQQAQMSQQLQNIMDSNSGDLLNSSGRFSFDETTSKLRAPFSAMQIKNIKRSEKKGAENVSDEKFALLFQSHFSIGDGALIINITALSMPIVVIVHGSQEPQSQATILWDNAFSTFHRQPFYVESSAMWDILAAAMKMKFCAPSNPSIVVPNADIFSNQMLEALRKKALRQYGLATTSSPITSSSITWSQFCKDPLPDRNFTFWEWFHAAMKLIRDHLCDLWNRNYIMGFIDKQSAENLLLKCKPGTFLLRFSDSELGGLTIAFLKLNENNSSYVLNIEPLNSKKLLFRSLPDRILDLDELKTLHPNIHKSLAFGGHAKIPEQSTTGYVAMNVQVSLPRSNISEIHENFNRMNVNHPSSSSLIGLQEDSTNIQLPEFNFCFR